MGHVSCTILFVYYNVTIVHFYLNHFLCLHCTVSVINFNNLFIFILDKAYAWCGNTFIFFCSAVLIFSVSLNSFRWILCHDFTMQICNHNINWYACQVCAVCCCYNSRRHHIINQNWKSTKKWTRMAANVTRMSNAKLKNFTQFMEQHNITPLFDLLYYLVFFSSFRFFSSCHIQYMF